jgi:hypothetical protein
LKYVLIGTAGFLVLIVVISQITLFVEKIGDFSKERKRLRRQKECVHAWDETECRCTICGFENHDWESYYVWVEEVCPHCGGNELLDCEFCGVGGMIETQQYHMRCRKCNPDKEIGEN